MSQKSKRSSWIQRFLEKNHIASVSCLKLPLVLCSMIHTNCLQIYDWLVFWYTEKELLKKMSHIENLFILMVNAKFTRCFRMIIWLLGLFHTLMIWSFWFSRFFLLTYSALLQDSCRCTCINDSIGVIHLLTGSLLIMGMWNVGEISPWMSFPRNMTPRNL